MNTQSASESIASASRAAPLSHHRLCPRPSRHKAQRHPGAVAGHDQVAVRRRSESADQPGGERGRGVGLGRHSGGGGGLGQEIMNRDGNKNIYLTIYILIFGGKHQF